MAGNHRATPTKSSRPKSARTRTSPARSTRARTSQRVSARAVAIAAVVALIPAVGFGVHRLLDGSDSPSTSSSGAPTTLPIPPVTTPGTPSPSTPATAPPGTPVSKPPAQPRLPRVAADVPRRLVSAGLLNVGFDNSVEPVNGTFRAGSTAEVARWGSRGKPGTPATDTVYIVGKTYARGVSAFDTLPKVKVGAKIVLRTDNGDLTYTVRSVATQASAGLTRNAAFAAKAPGRLVLVGLRYDRSTKLTGQAVVVTAEITGSIPK